MARHVKTIEHLDDKNRTWVFYEATGLELRAMILWCAETFGDALEYSDPDLVTMDVLSENTYRQAFIFYKRDDAMRFKLSW